MRTSGSKISGRGLKTLLCLLCLFGLAIGTSWGRGVRGQDLHADFPQQGIAHAEGEILVKLKKGVSRQYSLSRRFPDRTERAFSGLYKVRRRIYLHVRSDTHSTDDLLKIYRSDPAVESASPNYARSPHQFPSDPGFGRLWGLFNTGQVVNGIKGKPGADIRATQAWDVSTGAATVVVAVIDSGIYYLHEDLAENVWINPNEIPGNGLDDDGNGYVDDIYGYDFASDDQGNNDPDPMDMEVHGSHVSGIIGAVGNNGVGTAGVSWHVKIMALKAMRPDGHLYDSDIIEAIQYAIVMKERGVNVVAINASFGGSGGGQDDPLNSVIAEAGQGGMIFVASAGNSHQDNDVVPQYPASYNAPNIISVAATDSKDDLASFSSYGPVSVDLAAPGKNIYSTVPQAEALVLWGEHEYQAMPFEFAGYTSGITGTLYDCGKGYPEEFPSTVVGNIALVERGSRTEEPFYFADKVRNAMDAGAAAVIVYDDIPEPQLINVTLLSADDWAPAVFISQEDGLKLLSLETPEVTVVNEVLAAYDFLDGTSMAAPHVTGAIAILASVFPGETASRRMIRLLRGTQHLAALSGKVATGGRLNLSKSVNLSFSSTLAPVLRLLVIP